MVKIGFIVEGNSDVILLKNSKNLKYIFDKYNLDVKDDCILNARGKFNLKKHYISLNKKLEKKELNHVFIMLDQDDKEEQKKNKKYKPKDCPLVVIDEIIKYRDNKNYKFKNVTFIIMTRELEAWFLADEKLGFDFEGNPEEILNPSKLVGKKFKSSNHIIYTNKLKDKFSLVRASKNAPSAKRFLEKLQELSNK